MKLTRTANAGVLLQMQKASILLDGVCAPLPPYLGTPDTLRAQLTENFPDVVAFTHRHPDHFDETYAEAYETKTLRSILGPESFPPVGGCRQIGGISIYAIPSRHIGKAGECAHVSYAIKGEKCVWFMGDASPMQGFERPELLRPDVLIIPFAFCTNKAAWKATKKLDAKAYVLLHMPDKTNDPYDLWKLVGETVGDTPAFFAPAIGETLNL